MTTERRRTPNAPAPRPSQPAREEPPTDARGSAPPSALPDAPKTELGAWLDGFVRDPTFLERYPYYAAILARMTPVVDPSVKRMAVSLHDGRFYLHVNVESFLAEPQYLRGVLLHEVHHVALGHLSHPKFIDASEPELMDLAIEMSANEYIEEPLPDPIVWQPYATLGLRAGQSTIERYEKLLEAHRQGASVGSSRGTEQQRSTSTTGATGARPRLKPDLPSERTDDHRFLRRPAREPGAVEQTRQLLQRATEEAEQTLAALPDDAPSRLVAGRSPGRLVEELTGTLEPAHHFLDWKTALRMFIARERAPVHTWARPSRRFPGRVGEVPGRAWSPRLITRPSLIAAIDTSMSMTRPELEEIARQLTVVAEHARVTVVECDVEITRVYPFAGVIDEVAGRGGTDLRPVFDDAFVRAQKPDGIVYFTDGEGPTPDDPPRVPTLWILTKPIEFACPWGERAWFERKGGAPPRSAPKGRARGGSRSPSKQGTSSKKP